MFYEIRNYHIDPKYFEGYKKWSRELAYPYAITKLDIVGFWMKNDMPVEYDGALPRDENVVPSNVTWVIRWKDMEHRKKGWEDFRSGWGPITSLVPGGQEIYLREEVKFAESI